MRDLERVIEGFSETKIESNMIETDNYNAESGRRTNITEMRRKACLSEDT